MGHYYSDMVHEERWSKPYERFPTYVGHSLIIHYKRGIFTSISKVVCECGAHLDYPGSDDNVHDHIHIWYLHHMLDQVVHPSWRRERV